MELGSIWRPARVARQEPSENWATRTFSSYSIRSSLIGLTGLLVRHDANIMLPSRITRRAIDVIRAFQL